MAKFHILGPLVVIIVSGTVAFESLILGEVSADKIGYAPNRPYQIQSGLNNLATAVTALLVVLMHWGRYADAAIVTSMLLFCSFSAINHAATAFRAQNLRPVSLLRPLMALALAGVLLPPMLKALAQ